MNYNAECLFPSLLHLVETKVDSLLKLYCLEARQADPVGVRASNSGGWQSEGNRNNSLITDSLYNLFDNSINKVFQQKLQIVNHWININGPNTYNIIHDHPMSDLAGVYYVSVPKNSGDIYFQNPQCFVAHSELNAYNIEARQYLRQELQKYIEPQDGLLLLFPAYLKHGVTVNQSNEDRISVSFNIKLI